MMLRFCRNSNTLSRTFIRRTRVACAPISSSRLFSDSATAVPSPEIEDIVQRICKLNVLEMSKFTDILKERLNIPDSALMGAPVAVGVPAAGGSAGGEAEEGAEPEPEVERSYTVKMTSFGKKKIHVIKVVRPLLKLGIKEAKELVENIPAVLGKEMNKADAEELIKVVKEAGAELEMV
eukprot:265409_1